MSKNNGSGSKNEHNCRNPQGQCQHTQEEIRLQYAYSLRLLAESIENNTDDPAHIKAELLDMAAGIFDEREAQEAYDKMQAYVEDEETDINKPNGLGNPLMRF